VKTKIGRRNFIKVSGGLLVLSQVGCSTDSPKPAASAPAPKPPTESEFVERLLEVRENEKQGIKKQTAPFKLSPEQLPLAYSIQEKLHEALVAKGDKIVGWKNAFATDASHKALGIKEPTFSPVFASGNAKGSIDVKNFSNMLVEQEIVLFLAHDISQRLNEKDLLKCVKEAHLGFELPSVRFTGATGKPEGPTAADITADMTAFHSYCIGPKLPKEVITSTTYELNTNRDGNNFMKGNTGMLNDGSGGLGALKALEWLVGKLIERRDRMGISSNVPVLKKGEFVYTGAVPAPTPLGPISAAVKLVASSHAKSVEITVNPA
jgi:2-keto-4-pentenoate hydratase